VDRVDRLWSYEILQVAEDEERNPSALVHNHLVGCRGEGVLD